MLIHVVAGTGPGPTKLAAFDAALIAAGIANHNLIRLSSIVPPGAQISITDGPIKEPIGEWGDRLYVVMAETRISIPNMEAWAGIGWVQDKKTGQGLFVEHEGTNEQTVRRDITESLEALMAARELDFGPIDMKIVGITCRHEPVCALVAAVFKAENW
jgi:arginine decarboxylase